MDLLKDVDMSKLEDKIMAFMKDDLHVKNIFRGGLDVHTFTASEIFEVDSKEVTSEQRRFAKCLNTVLIYHSDSDKVLDSLKVYLEKQEHVPECD